MARDARIDPRTFRDALRAARLPWHRHGEPWIVEAGRERHRQLDDILHRLATMTVAPPLPPPGRMPSPRPTSRAGRDESYVIDLCDRILGIPSLRQHRFDWLVGDGPRPARLPVDAYYPTVGLVVEYRERQHAEPVPFFDKPHRITVSGVDRGGQRALYDGRRRDLIPRHGLRLVEIDVVELAHDRRGRLSRDAARDEVVVRSRLER